MQNQNLLQLKLSETIASNGPIPFSNFMQQALYHPNYGYYAQPQQRVGKRGDFFTSVSVGPCFGWLLAQRIYTFWNSLSQPNSLMIFEFGGNDGQLACDILKASKQLNSSFFKSLHYHLVEPLTTLQRIQQEKLNHYSQQVSWVSNLNHLKTVNSLSFVFGNELLDALPVERIRLTHQIWNQAFVDYQNGEFCWLYQPPSDSSLVNYLSYLGNKFPNNYSTEVCLQASLFIQTLIQIFPHALFVWLDYGFNHSEYYHPQRIDGTLQTYSRHRQASDPLANPGTLDITTHVNFSHWHQISQTAKLQTMTFTDQARYLTQLLKSSPLPFPKSWVKAFQTLTHPSLLGKKFHILESATSSIPIATPVPPEFNQIKML